MVVDVMLDHPSSSNHGVFSLIPRYISDGFCFLSFLRYKHISFNFIKFKKQHNLNISIHIGLSLVRRLLLRNNPSHKKKRECLNKFITTVTPINESDFVI